jgi:hypothetical protein
MSRHVETGWTTKSHDAGSHSPQKTTESDNAKKKWIQKYSRRLLRLWLGWPSPLGVASTYAEHIKKDLAEFYEDPLKKKFIETTYY